MTLFEKLCVGSWTAAASFSALDAARVIPAGLIEGAPLCPFHAITGVPCPGCGMTRGLAAAFQGRWEASAAYHPLALPLLAVWTAWLAWGLYNRARGHAFSQDFPDLSRGARGWALLALVLAVYAARLAARLA